MPVLLRPTLASTDKSAECVVTRCVRGAGAGRGRGAGWSSDIRLLALDMDGTLLDSNSKVLPSSIKAIKVG